MLLVLSRDSVLWMPSRCSRSACDRGSHQDSVGMANAQMSERSGTFPGIRELSQGVHSGNGRSNDIILWADRIWSEVGMDRGTHSGFWGAKKDHVITTSARVSQYQKPVHIWHRCIWFCNWCWAKSTAGWQGASHFICQQDPEFWSTQVLPNPQGIAKRGSVHPSLSTLFSLQPFCGAYRSCKFGLVDGI